VRNRRLNELVRDLEFDFSVDDLELGPVNEDQVREVFAKLSFRTLLTRVIKLRGVNGSQHRLMVAKVEHEEHHEPLLQEASTFVADLPGSIPPKKFATAKQLAKLLSSGFVEIEIGNQEILGFAVATKDERFEWDGKDREQIRELIEAGGFGCWNNKQLAKQLGEITITLGPVRDDAMLASYLIDPLTKDPNPDALVRQFAGIDVVRQDPNELLADSDPSLNAWCYAVIGELLIKRLESEGGNFVYREVELKLAPVLARMEKTGIAVDVQGLQTQFDELTAEVEQIAQQAYEIIGHEVNLASPKQLQTVLFEELGMTGTRSVKTGFSTNAEALATLYEQTEHPFLERLLAHRDSTKMKQMTETLLKSVASDGRIHTSYSQTGTATGRLSSENPNLQNIPIKSDRGAKLRAAFLAGQGYETLLTADYSQIEMRIMAHLSGDEGLIDAYQKGEDLHNYVGSRIYGVRPEDVTSEMRSKVKAMSYGLVYGLSEYGLARQLRISKSEAKQLMSDYFDRFGGVKRYLDTVVQRAKTAGYTQTVYGRRRPFPDLNSKIFQVRENARRAALNAPIQGTAADIMKLAMVEIQQKLDEQGLKSRLLLQVHDELVFEVFPGELEKLRELAVGIMESTAKLSVPVEVHVGIGANWNLAGH
jgi:DNA polymerase-1